MTETTRKPSLATRIRDLVAGDGGFTLLETLAVMVIVGLLAAITVPQIAKWREKAYITSLKTDARNVANAIEASFVDNQKYPANSAEFLALVDSDVKLSDGNTVRDGWGWAGGYYTTGSIFQFRVVSSKANKQAVYNNTLSPTISITAS